MRSISAIFLLLLACPAYGETVNKILATVDGDPITTQEIQQFLVTRARGQDIPEGIRPDSPQVLDAYITEKLIQKEISDQGIVVTDADVDRYVEGIRAQNKLSMDRLKQAVEMQGMSWDSYRTQVREELLKAQLINREIRGKVNVTPEQIQRYYEKHKDEFSSSSSGGGAEVKVYHMLWTLPGGASDTEVEEVVKQAETVRGKIEDVDDFVKVAKAAGDDTGGDLGYLDPDSMQEELGAAVKKLKPGKVSEPIVSGGAVHLLMVGEVKKQEGDTAQAGQYSDQIKQKLYNEAIEERYDRWLREDLRVRHYVDIRP